MINFINKKFEEFNKLINKEIENIFTDENNEKIKDISNLLNKFNFNDDENKFNELFTIFNKSIFIKKEIIEKKLNLDKNKDYYILYEGEIIKGKILKMGKELNIK